MLMLMLRWVGQGMDDQPSSERISAAQKLELGRMGPVLVVPTATG